MIPTRPKRAAAGIVPGVLLAVLLGVADALLDVADVLLDVVGVLLGLAAVVVVVVVVVRCCGIRSLLVDGVLGKRGSPARFNYLSVYFWSRSDSTSQRRRRGFQNLSRPDSSFMLTVKNGKTVRCHRLSIVKARSDKELAPGSTSRSRSTAKGVHNVNASSTFQWLGFR